MFAGKSGHECGDCLAATKPNNSLPTVERVSKVSAIPSGADVIVCVSCCDLPLLTTVFSQPPVIAGTASTDLVGSFGKYAAQNRTLITRLNMAMIICKKLLITV